MTDLDVLLRAGMTGVASVDILIRQFNPYGLTSKMTISSPDWPPASRTVTFP
jgi:hypothetical protein